MKPNDSDLTPVQSLITKKLHILDCIGICFYIVNNIIFLTGKSLFKIHCFVICLPSPLLLQAALLTRTPTT